MTSEQLQEPREPPHLVLAIGVDVLYQSPQLLGHHVQTTACLRQVHVAQAAWLLLQTTPVSGGVELLAWDVTLNQSVVCVCARVRACVCAFACMCACVSVDCVSILPS